MSTLKAEDLREFLSGFVGRKCSSYAAGGSGGSAISIQFDGGASIFVTCAWRLDDRETVLFGCWSEGLISGNKDALDKLVGAELTAFFLREPGMDLDLFFTDEKVFRVFCDQVDPEDPLGNFLVTTVESSIKVESLSFIREGT